MNSSKVDDPVTADFQASDGASVGFTGATGLCLVLAYLFVLVKYLEKRRSRAEWSGEHWALGCGVVFSLRLFDQSPD